MAKHAFKELAISGITAGYDFNFDGYSNIDEFLEQWYK